MNTRVGIDEALAVLRAGGILLYPTDTVWGLGCDACNEEAVRKIFAVKRRSDSKSLVLLAGSVEMIERYVDQMPQMALRLIEVNDAPMTIIYPGAFVKDDGSPVPGLAPSTVAADGSAGIRIPVASAFCMTLLERFGGPIVSTSANISGEATPRTFADISPEIKVAVDYVVPQECETVSSGKASQIIKVDTDGVVKVIRS